MEGNEMMNIQFMTKRNAITVKDDFTGEDKIVYVPDFEKLIANASCEEEIEAIKKVEEIMTSDKSVFKGFTFEIVYMEYRKTLNLSTCKWETKWQMYQHPWYRTHEGVYHTKEQMIEIIENEKEN